MKKQIGYFLVLSFLFYASQLSGQQDRLFNDWHFIESIDQQNGNNSCQAYRLKFLKNQTGIVFIRIIFQKNEAEFAEYWLQAPFRYEALPTDDEQETALPFKLTFEQASIQNYPARPVSDQVVFDSNYVNDFIERISFSESNINCVFYGDNELAIEGFDLRTQKETTYFSNARRELKCADLIKE